MIIIIIIDYYVFYIIITPLTQHYSLTHRNKTATLKTSEVYPFMLIYFSGQLALDNTIAGGMLL